MYCYLHGYTGAMDPRCGGNQIRSGEGRWERYCGTGVVRRWSGWWERGTEREEQDRLAYGKSSGAARDKTTFVGRDFFGEHADIWGGGGGGSDRRVQEYCHQIQYLQYLQR